jgi:hypothetical protein
MGLCLALDGLPDQNGLRMPLILQDVRAASRCKRRAGIKAIGACVEIASAIVQRRRAAVDTALRLTKLSKVSIVFHDPTPSPKPG